MASGARPLIIGSFDQTFPLKNKLNIVEDCSYASRWEPRLAEAVNVREFLTPVLQHHDRAAQPWNSPA
jgi:hypothetical protein